ncbi:MAG: hypothetical protein MZV63_35910 [Marinilabiliales bacterium]|nr:hypothetical protein [Marinilabiliales bacterium]
MSARTRIIDMAGLTDLCSTGDIITSAGEQICIAPEPHCSNQHACIVRVKREQLGYHTETLRRTSSTVCIRSANEVTGRLENSPCATSIRPE